MPSQRKEERTPASDEPLRGGEAADQKRNRLYGCVSKRHVPAEQTDGDQRNPDAQQDEENEVRHRLSARETPQTCDERQARKQAGQNRVTERQRSAAKRSASRALRLRICWIDVTPFACRR